MTIMVYAKSGERLPAVEAVFRSELLPLSELKLTVVSYSGQERKGTLALFEWERGMKLLVQEAYADFWILRPPLCEAHPFHGPATGPAGPVCEVCREEVDDASADWTLGGEQWPVLYETLREKLVEEFQWHIADPLEALVVATEALEQLTALRSACHRAWGFY